MDQDEDVLDSEVNKIYGRCRCCLEPGYVKNMWTEYLNDGAREIYGEMLMETFSVAWESNQDNKEQICDMCVDRLRDAYMFKREVLASEQVLKEGVLDSKSETIKDERASELDQYENTTEYIIEETEYKEEGLEQEVEYEELDTKVLEADNEDQEAEYEEVEYLEDEITPEMLVNSNTSTNRGESSKQADKPKRKRIPGLNIRNYRNYTEQALREGIDAALSSNKPLSEVAAQFGVPRKTLTGRLFNLKQKPKPESLEEIEKTLSQEQHYRFVLEIKKVLASTNVIPFKVKSGRFYCAYCFTTHESFDTGADLRFHTLLHRDERVDRLDQILRPQFLNEILRVDIHLLQCEICTTSLSSWNEMFAHLNEIHNIELDQAYSKLIPYKLKGQTAICALCDEVFPAFQYLDSHMNGHYCNYVCADCGDPFVTQNRLKHHVSTHSVGKHPCRYCGKVFTLEKYKKKHEAMVHKDSKMFKCADCGEAFHSEFERHTHIVANHKERVRISTCEMCGKTFDWKPYYLAHIRKVHNKVKKFKCPHCNKGFSTNHELKNHVLRHTGEGKYPCMMCGKNFVRQIELKNHFKKHVKEVKFLNEDEIKETQLSELILGT